VREGWLLREATVLASATVPEALTERVRAALDAPRDGAVLVAGWWLPHTVALAGPLEVAFLDNTNTVIATVHLSRWRAAAPRLRARGVLTAPAGSFERWALSVGDCLEFRATP
jgi:Uncharacterized ACR, COG1430